MVSRLSDFSAGLLIGLILGAFFAVLFPPVVPKHDDMRDDFNKAHYVNGADLGTVVGNIDDEFVYFVPCFGDQHIQVRSLHLAYTGETCASLPQ